MEKKHPEETRTTDIKITTTQPIGKGGTPQQPNERDESPDSQPSAPRADMQQAAADLASGQVNTDLRDQPAMNPKNTAAAIPSPKSIQKLPDGREK